MNALIEIVDTLKADLEGIRRYVSDDLRLLLPDDLDAEGIAAVVVHLTAAEQKSAEISTLVRLWRTDAWAALKARYPRQELLRNQIAEAVLGVSGRTMDNDLSAIANLNPACRTIVGATFEQMEAAAKAAQHLQPAILSQAVDERWSPSEIKRVALDEDVDEWDRKEAIRKFLSLWRGADDQTKEAIARIVNEASKLGHDRGSMGGRVAADAKQDPRAGMAVDLNPAPASSPNGLHAGDGEFGRSVILPLRPVRFVGSDLAA